MTNLRFLACLAATGLLCALARAQQPQLPPSQTSTDNNAPQTKDTAQPNIPGRPVIIPPDQGPDKLSLPPRPQRPNNPQDPVPPESVRALVKDFQSARQEFLRAQDQLRRRLREATQEERAALREQLKENLANWLAQQRSRVQELRDQARDIKEKVPSLNDVVGSGVGEGRRK